MQKTFLLTYWLLRISFQILHFLMMTQLFPGKMVFHAVDHFYTVNEIFIGAPQILNNYCALFFFLILRQQYLNFLYSSLYIIIALDLLCFTFGISSVLLLFFFESVTSDNNCGCNSWKSDNCMGSNIEKKPRTKPL